MRRPLSTEAAFLYMDYNATTPVAPSVRDAVTICLDETWANPSSGHPLGRKAREVLEAARTSMASLLKADSGEIVFTSGGTESNNAVLLGIVPGLFPAKAHVVTTQIEHPSVLNPAIRLMELGYEVTFVGVDRQGVVSPDAVDAALRPETVLVSVMLANNETGAVQPVGEIARRARARGVLVHTDAAQAIGKMSVDVRELDVDYLTVAGHKLYAPKGIGALFMRKGAPIAPFLYGSGQEAGRRPGTEPVPMAVGLGEAARLAGEDLAGEAARLVRLRERLFDGILSLRRPVVRHGTPKTTLSNTLCVSFPGLIGAKILEEASPLMASTGAACHDRTVAVSHVLSAMGVDQEVALGTIRLSLGRWTRDADVERAVDALDRAIRSM